MPPDRVGEQDVTDAVTEPAENASAVAATITFLPLFGGVRLLPLNETDSTSFMGTLCL